MRAWSVIYDKLHHMGQLSYFIRKALHDVLHQHAHDPLSFLVLVLDKSRFHGTPRCVEPVAQTHKSTILSHECILELWTSITTYHRRYGPAPHDATCKHPPGLCGSESSSLFQKSTVAEAADISHRVLTS